MALTPLRWVIAAAAGCAIALALVLSFDPARRGWRYSEREVLAERVSRLDRASTSVARQLRATLLADSVESALARMPRSSVSRVVAGRSFRRGTEFSAGLMNRLGAGGSASGGAPIDVVLLVDSAVKIRGKTMFLFTRVTHVLPATRDQRCIAIVRFDPRAEREGRYSLAHDHVASEILGPCGYYASFGAPGAGVDRWLRGNGWAFGTHAAGYRRARFATEEWMSWMDGSVPWAADAGFPLRRLVGDDGYGCVTGDRDACLRAVLSPKVTSRRLGMERVSGDGLISRPLISDLYFANNAFGIASHDLLSDMVASLGNDKFRRFWTSDQPPAEAFLAATGEDLGAWLTRWAAERYGEARRGPGAPADGALVSFLVAIGAVAAATVAARRRQVA